MSSNKSAMRRGAFGVLAASLLGGAAAATFGVPMASADPACTASGLLSTVSSVSSQASTYLIAHPGADQVLTNAVSLPADQAESTVRDYFYANPGEYFDLKGITAPLNNLNGQCGTSLTANDLIAAFQRFQEG